MNKFTYADRCKTYTNAMLVFGERNQLIVAIEELSECQKEICKILRGGEDFRNLAEEIADATIMLEQISLMFNINLTAQLEISHRVRIAKTVLQHAMISAKSTKHGNRGWTKSTNGARNMKQGRS